MHRLPRLTFLASCFLFTAPRLVFSEDLDYIVEHLLEAPMDARYLAFPEMEANPDQPQWRLQIGRASFKGLEINNQTMLAGVQYYYPLSEEGWGLLAGVFAGSLQYHGANFDAKAGFIYATELGTIAPQNIHVDAASGDGTHLGLTVALTHRYSDAWGWQAGLALESLEADNFVVSFHTTDKTVNYVGRFDYSARYNAVTPFAGIHWFHDKNWLGLRWSGRVILTWPLPRRALQSRLQASGHAFYSDGGRFKVMPDMFVGVGYALEGIDYRWRLDVGATLFYLGGETALHNGIKQPLLVTLTLPFD